MILLNTLPIASTDCSLKKSFTKGYIDFSNVNHISKEDFDEINKRSRVDTNDIIMPMIGTVGSPVIV